MPRPSGWTLILYNDKTVEKKKKNVYYKKLLNWIVLYETIRTSLFDDFRMQFAENPQYFPIQPRSGSDFGYLLLCTELLIFTNIFRQIYIVVRLVRLMMYELRELDI